jgi:hypothetical protein
MPPATNRRALSLICMGATPVCWLRGHGLPNQRDRADRFVVMLHRINEIEFELGKFLRRGHRTHAPEQPLDGEREEEFRPYV